ncbi:MAG TPA: response regulator [Opitutus sp.]|nr:response regulator [Opitutus sp.]
MPDRAARLQRRFGQALRAERTAQNLTQQELAFQAELSLTYIGEIERGERMVSLDTLFRVAHALKMTASDLLAKVEAVKTPPEERLEVKLGTGARGAASTQIVLPASGSSPILIAEDDQDDLSLVRHFFNVAGIKRPLIAVRNGEELIDFLRPACDPATSAGAVKPCVLFLDINMPKVDGFEALEWIRSQPALKDMPVIALSSVIEPHDIKRAAKLGVTRFMTKYPRPQVFAEIVESYCGAA